MNNDVIVLIDTGLDKEIYRNRIVGGIHFYIEDEMICCDKNYNDDKEKLYEMTFCMWYDAKENGTNQKAYQN